MKIEFLPSTQEVSELVPPPKPAGEYLPDWYKKAKTGREKPLYSPDGKIHLSFKACMPFLDSLKMGYIQETWSDLYVDSSINNGQFTYGFATGPDLVTVRVREQTEDFSFMPTSASGFCPVEMVWHMPWIPRLPKGWSVLVTHPLGRLDLPFMVTSGIIDADVFYHAPLGQVPFYIHKDFCGTIPAGTPMMQIIPIKRSDWKSSVLSFDAIESKKRSFVIRKKFTGAYRDEFWKTKKYE
jgi:hypothetical protein